MIRYRYIGEDPTLKGRTALGMFTDDAEFKIQLDFSKEERTSYWRDRKDIAHRMCYGWHRVDSSVWLPIEAVLTTDLTIAEEYERLPEEYKNSIQAGVLSLAKRIDEDAGE